MKNWSIRTRLIAGFGVVLAVIVSMGALTYWRLAQVRRDVVEIETDSIAGLVKSAAIRAGWVDDLSYVQQMLLEQNPAERQRLPATIKEHQNELRTAIAEYEPTVFTTRDRQLFDAFKSAV